MLYHTISYNHILSQPENPKCKPNKETTLLMRLNRRAKNDFPLNDCFLEE